MEVPSTPSDPSYIPQGCQEPHLIERSEPNDPARDVNAPERPAELLGMKSAGLKVRGFPCLEREIINPSIFSGTQGPVA
jgi:hypothetical protein